MQELDRSRGDRSPLGCVVALVLLFLPGIVDAVRGPPTLWSLALFRGAWLALPFAYLGMKGIRARREWLVVIILMTCFWAGPMAVTAIRPESHEITVDTIMGMVMLASPFVAIIGARAAMRSRT